VKLETKREILSAVMEDFTAENLEALTEKGLDKLAETLEINWEDYKETPKCGEPVYSTDKEIFYIQYKDIKVIKVVTKMSDTSPLATREFSYEINEDARKFTPPGFVDVEQWIKSRVIPKNRAFVGQILSSVSLSDNPFEVVRVSFGLAVTDNYWIVPEWFTGTFAEYNLHENDFSEALALVAFTGHTQKIKALRSSPELSTDGMLAKCWRRINGKNILYKSGMSGAGNLGYEPYSEFYVWQIAAKMGLNAIQYNIEHFSEKLCSTCEAFTSVCKSFSPYSQYLGHHGLNEVIKNMKSLGFYEKFAEMLVLDAIICNSDRHLGNFGFVYNKESGFVDFAPIFDNGFGLLPQAYDKDWMSIENLEAYANDRISAFDISHTNILRAIITQKLKTKVSRLIKFKFTRHLHFNLEESRLILLEEYVQRRVREILVMPNASE